MTNMTWGLTLWSTLGWSDGGTLHFKGIRYQRSKRQNMKMFAEKTSSGTEKGHNCGLGPHAA